REQGRTHLPARFRLPEHTARLPLHVAGAARRADARDGAAHRRGLAAFPDESLHPAAVHPGDLSDYRPRGLPAAAGRQAGAPAGADVRDDARHVSAGLLPPPAAVDERAVMAGRDDDGSPAAAVPAFLPGIPRREKPGVADAAPVPAAGKMALPAARAPRPADDAGEWSDDLSSAGEASNFRRGFLRGDNPFRGGSLFFPPPLAF